jgi:hypothetical protein
MFVLAMFASAVGIVVLGSVLRGLTISVLWGWFIVPTFNIAALSIPVAIGVGLILSYITHQEIKTDGDKKVADIIIRTILNPLVVIGFGWIVKLFM